MPEFLPAAVAEIGAAIGGDAGAFLIMNAEAVASATVIAGTAALSYSQAERAKRKAIGDYNAAQADRLANIVNTGTQQRELVLGRVRKGGFVNFRGSAGPHLATYLFHLDVAAHACDAIEAVYFNDEQVTLDADGYVTSAPYAQQETIAAQGAETIPAGSTSVTVAHAPISASAYQTVTREGFDGGTYQEQVLVDCSISGSTISIAAAMASDVTVLYNYRTSVYYARVWWDLDATGVVSQRTKELFPDLWTNAHREEGVARVFCEFTYNQTALPSGIPKVTVLLRGARIYDPRDPAQDPDDESTWVYSDNPALQIRHVYTHPNFGKATVSAAEEARIIAAANACDTLQDYGVDGVTDTQKLFRSNLVAPFGSRPWDIIDDLAQAMAGKACYARGELYLRAGVYTAPVMTFDDSDLAVIQRVGDREEYQPLSTLPHREEAEKFNTLNLRIFDEQQGFRQVPVPAVTSAALKARDGKTLAQALELNTVTYSPQAQHIAGVLMRDARDPLTLDVPFKVTAYPAEIYDVVNLELARYGIDGTFEVMERSWDPSKLLVRLRLKETAAAIFTPDAEFLPGGYAENTALPRPWNISPPALSADRIQSGTSLLRLVGNVWQPTIEVTWPAMANASILSGGRIEIQWRLADSDERITVETQGSDTRAIIVGPSERQLVLVRGRSRNALAVSDWSVEIPHVVVGKDEAPTAPPTVAATPTAVAFGLSPDVDVAGYRISYSPGAGTQASVATSLHDGLVTASPWPMPVRLYGVNTVFVVTVDTSGNVSEATYDTQDFGQPDAANVADEVDYVELDFYGDVTNGSVVGAELLADADPSADFWGEGSGADLWHRDGAADFWGGSQYLQLTYIATYTCPYSGGTLFLDLTTEGSRTTVETRIDGSPVGDFWDSGADFWSGSSFYGAEQTWRPWAGSLTPTDAGKGIQFRVTVDAGSVQGAITAMAVRTEMPQIESMFGRVVVAAAGTVVDPTSGTPARNFIAIEDVQVTPIGATAVAGRVKSYPIDPDVGPEIELLDAAGVVVDNEAAFVRMSGY